MRPLPCDSARRSGVANPLIRGSQPVWMVTRVAREAKRARSSPFRLPADASPSSRSAGAVGRSSSMAMSMQDKIVESASRASPRARINSQRRRPPRHLHDVCSIAWWRGSLAAGVSANTYRGVAECPPIPAVTRDTERNDLRAKSDPHHHAIEQTS